MPEPFFYGNAIRVYNKAPHAHLVEYGYIRGQAGHIIKGKNVLGISEKMFEAHFAKQAERYVDKLLEKGLIPLNHT